MPVSKMDINNSAVMLPRLIIEMLNERYAMICELRRMHKETPSYSINRRLSRKINSYKEVFSAGVNAMKHSPGVQESSNMFGKA